MLMKGDLRLTTGLVLSHIEQIVCSKSQCHCEITCRARSHGNSNLCLACLAWIIISHKEKGFRGLGTETFRSIPLARHDSRLFHYFAPFRLLQHRVPYKDATDYHDDDALLEVAHDCLCFMIC